MKTKELQAARGTKITHRTRKNGVIDTKYRLHSHKNYVQLGPLSLQIVEPTSQHDVVSLR
jgi:hypothetical protein